MDAQQRITFIRDRLHLVPVPGFPELRHWAPHPASGLSLLDYDEAPYWAYLWPGGAALLHHLTACPNTVAGRRVLDLGAGSGLAGIMALKQGATSALASDPSDMAQSVAAMNAVSNEVTLKTTGATSSTNLPQIDLVLAGDIFYDADMAALLLPLLRSLRDTGAEVLIGDIGRRHLPDGLRRIAHYPVRDVGDSPATAPLTAGVFSLP
ncbi:class I SAM-dependent methyltransferase [Pseudooceanicola sp. C21-150M6]|uniref:class I SAM-dependent methyltransferase n=1 Tax=Pseudooceanicola sp. C21-150M6 TaxID=3434355 RepID=UPI003D7FE5F5